MGVCRPNPPSLEPKAPWKYSLQTRVRSWPPWATQCLPSYAMQYEQVLMSILRLIVRSCVGNRKISHPVLPIEFEYGFFGTEQGVFDIECLSRQQRRLTGSFEHISPNQWRKLGRIAPCQTTQSVVHCWLQDRHLSLQSKACRKYGTLHANQSASSFEKETWRPFAIHENKGTQPRQNIPYVEDSPVVCRAVVKKRAMMALQFTVAE